MQPIASSTNPFPIMMTYSTSLVKIAIRVHVENFIDVGSNELGAFEGFSTDDANDLEIPMMHSQ